MSIKRVEFTYKKGNTRLDRNTGKYIGHQIDVRFNGRRHRNTFATKREAEFFIDELRKANRFRRAGVKGSPQIVRVSDLFAARKAKITNAKEKIRAQRVFAEFERCLEGSRLVADVRPSDFQQFIKNRLEDGVQPQTVNREMTLLSTAFKQAHELFPRELEDFEPPRIVRPKFKKKGRTRVITPEEKDLIINSILNDRLPQERPARTESRPAVARMFELAWYMGLRFSEAKNYKPADFNEKANTLRVVRMKTGTVDVLPYLPERVREILAEGPFDIKCSDHTVAAIIRDACDANGIEYGRDTLDGVTFHSTRHSFTSRLVQHTDLATAQSYTGHSTGEMLGWYAHPSDESKRLAMERMYGTGRADSWREVFEKIAAGEMTFEEFWELVK